MISPELLSAYLGTVYWVETPERAFPLRIGQVNPDWDRFLETEGVAEWIFVTPCNPRSELLSPAENRRLITELYAELKDRQWWPGLGVGGNGDWFPEASVCVALSEVEGVALGRRYQQHAIVTGHRGREARLRWIDDDAGAAS